MSKRITMQARPNRGPQADQWVEDRKIEPKKLLAKPKRLTIDIDPDLHRRLKIHCVTSQIQISDFLS